MQRPAWIGLVFVVIALAGLIAVAAGPPLGEHEAIVGLIARNTLQTGNWLVPYCVGTPFIIKPPLPGWAAAAASMILPHDAASGMAVTAFSARLPSLLCTILTVWMLFLLSRSMLGRRTAWLTAFIYATSVGAWLFAVNATAEAMITFFATWAFAEFWWTTQSKTPSARRLHLLRFYVAFGLAMLAKGPMPLSVVAIPIAIFWWCERPTRLLAARGIRRAGDAAGYGLRHGSRRLLDALTHLGLWWGVPIFLAMFLPWMLYIARHDPLAWSIWDFEYLHRMRGDYPGIEKSPGAWYYLPLMFGLMIPWALSIPEALAAPFMRVYRAQRRGLTYAWFWAIVSVGLMSIMTFKKPYYILPAMPAFALLLTPVVARFFDAARTASAQKVRTVLIAVLLLLIAAAVAGGILSVNKYPDAWTTPLARWAIPTCVAMCIAGVAVTGLFFLRRNSAASTAALGITTVIAFTVGWCVFGPVLDDSAEANELAEKLLQHGVPADAPLWVANRPDTRFVFYGHVAIKPLVDPYRLVAEDGGTWDDPKHKEKVAGMMYDMLKSDKSVCILMDTGQSSQFIRWYNPRARELFTIDRGAAGDSKDDLVVLTNRGLAASRPTVAAVTRP